LPDESAAAIAIGGVGREFGKLDQVTQWWVGDWWAFGEHHYGDRKAFVEGEDWSGPAFRTCHNAGGVCRAFTSDRRRSLLTF
jgi:hypothetical protein